LEKFLCQISCCWVLHNSSLFQHFSSELGGGSSLQILEDGLQTQVLLCSHFRVILCNVSLCSIQIWVFHRKAFLSTVLEMCCAFQDIPECLMSVQSSSINRWVEVEKFDCLSTFHIFMFYMPKGPKCTVFICWQRWHTSDGSLGILAHAHWSEGLSSELQIGLEGGHGRWGLGNAMTWNGWPFSSLKVSI
jgi:hypothetical protein